MQSYKSLCAAVTLVNIQTHTDRQRLISLYEKFSQLTKELNYSYTKVLLTQTKLKVGIGSRHILQHPSRTMIRPILQLRGLLYIYTKIISTDVCKCDTLVY